MSEEVSPQVPAPSPTKAASDSRFFVRASNFAKIMFVFVALGPAVGWFILLIPLLILSLFVGPGGGSTNALIPTLAIMLFAGTWLSYLLGGVSALLVGLVVAISQMVIRSFGIFHAAGIGLLVAFAVACGWIWPNTSGSVEALSGVHFLTLNNLVSVLTVVTTIICWATVSSWLRKVE